MSKQVGDFLKAGMSQGLKIWGGELGLTDLPKTGGGPASPLKTCLQSMLSLRIKDRFR